MLALWLALQSPVVDYRLVVRPDAPSRRWEVEVTAAGLDPAHPEVILELSDWGEWTEIDAYYLPWIALDAPPDARFERLEGTRNAWRVTAPPIWDGRLRVRYAVALCELGAAARERWGLGPYRAPTYVFGFSANTLVRVAQTDAGAQPERRITIEAPADWTVATGFGGVTRGTQTSAIPATHENSVISLGVPRATLSQDFAGGRIEVAQWGGERDVARELVDFARPLAEAATGVMGIGPTGPLRLFVTEPGMGGTRTDGSIAIGCPASLDGRKDPYTLHFLAHEIFHDWLGGRLRPALPGETLAWFWEGFTEYASLWLLAHTGEVPREWFAERLVDHDQAARATALWGQVAFADTTAPRRGGEHEILTYSGSALVAFAVDVELRRRGERGLFALLADLAARDGGRYGLDSLERWFVEHAAADLWQSHFACAIRVDLAELLVEAGFVQGEIDAPLTYLGIQDDEGVVRAIDPEGPAAAGGLQLGDRIFGRYPTRGVEPEISAEVTTAYRFGLTGFEPGANDAYLDVLRGDRELQVPIVPRLVPGGRLRSWAVDVARGDAFFR
jgi:predicted metalloprotease with PDZ domain